MITGKVVSGLGEGAFYVQKFRKNMEKELEMKIFPGTLNIKVSRKPVIHDFIEIKPPSEKFSAVKCAEVIINGEIRGAIVIPEKTRHEKNILEIVAPVNLRKALKLKDGDSIQIEVVE